MSTRAPRPSPSNTVLLTASLPLLLVLVQQGVGGEEKTRGEINGNDRGAIARAPLQSSACGRRSSPGDRADHGPLADMVGTGATWRNRVALTRLTMVPTGRGDVDHDLVVRSRTSVERSGQFEGIDHRRDPDHVPPGAASRNGWEPGILPLCFLRESQHLD